MRGALAVAAVGAGLVLIAAAFDVEALYSGGLVFLVVAAVAVLWVLASSRGLRVRRAVPRASVQEDERFPVTVTVQAGRVRPPVVTVQDGVRPEPVSVRLRRWRAKKGGRPDSIGGSEPTWPGRPVDGVPVPASRHAKGETTATVSYARRGRYTPPPPSARVADPFDLAAKTVPARDEDPRDRILVLPRLDDPGPSGQGRRGGPSDGGRGIRPSAGPETDLDGLRPHRTGTPASRIHWPAYARGAGLLERSLRADGDGLPLVVLEPPSPARPGDFDETVRVAAGRTVQLARSGGVAVLLPGDRRPTRVDRTLVAWPALHARLALVGPAARNDPPTVVAAERAGDRRTPPRWWPLLAWTGPAVVGTVTWAALFRPHLSAGLIPALVLSLALGAVVLGLGAAPRSRARTAGLVATAAAGVLVALLCTGLPVRVVLPTGWPELVSGLVHGAGAMPDVLVPYHHTDEWVRWTMLLGGTALLVAGALLAAWPRRDGTTGFPGATAAVLVVLYGAGIVAHSPPVPYVGGAVVALGLLALLRGPAIFAPGRGGLLRAGAIAAAAAAIAVVLAPALDAGHGWVDVGSHKPDADVATFDWNHSYSKLDWPRTGKTVLTVSSRRPAYWKATNLERFDGREWRAVRTRPAEAAENRALMAAHPEWVQRVSVSVGEMKTSLFIGAGTSLFVSGAPSTPIPSGQGTYMTAPGSSLSSGDTYTTIGYVPHPTSGQLRRAGTTYPADVAQDARLVLPPDLRGGYRRTTALAAQLAAAAPTPYDLVQRVIRRVQNGAVYSPDPGVHRLPLDAFLFDDRRGYCQQFSGAVALLLRLAGVPARVSAGFATGLEAGGGGGEHVFTVADLDAHSWVEVYFPGYGWVTFDPTPPSGPARTEPTVAEAVDRVTPPGPAAAKTSSATEITGQVAVASSGPSAGAIVGVAALLVAIGAAAALLVRRARRRRAAAMDPDAALAELSRALRRSGRPVPPATTLRELERLLDAYPAHPARGYLRTLSAARYAAPPAAGTGSADAATSAPVGPSRADRRGLRQGLARGGGARAWLRSWWAVPW